MEEELDQRRYGSTPAANKSLKLFSCALCHRRKVKCDKLDPCTYCVKNGVPCVPAAPTVPRARKRRFPEAELLARLKRYESVLRSHGFDVDAINNGDAPVKLASMSISSKSPGTEIAYSPPTKNEPDETGVYSSAEVEFNQAEELLQNSSDDEVERNPITASYDTIFENDGSNLLFGMVNLPASVDLAALHPPPMQIFSLWQVFIDNVNPLTKLFHVPTVQQQILKVGSDMSSASTAMHALMFSIYSFAVISLDEEACIDLLGESKRSVAEKYQTGAQCALHMAGFLRSGSLIVLQALVLYLMSVRLLMDPRSMSCFTAMLERMARRNGLHRDAPYRGMSLFETEMRKRLWWQIEMFDNRTAELAGFSTSMMSANWNAKLPLNLNDSDLNRDMTNPPAELAPVTDMVFNLVRCEITEFLRQMRISNGLDIGFSEFSNSSVPLEDKLHAIDEFEKHLENRYLKYCDGQIPLHVMARWAAQNAVGKWRLISYTSGNRKDRAWFPLAFAQHKERMLQLCIELVESEHRCKASKPLQRFLWYLNSNKPFLAHLYLIAILRTETTGPLIDRAWAAITESDEVYQGPRMYAAQAPGQNSAMSYGFSNLMVKAWEAREAALRNKIPVETPRLILTMKKRLMKLNKHPSATAAPSSAATSQAYFPYSGNLMSDQSQQTTTHAYSNIEGQLSIPVDSTGASELPTGFDDATMWDYLDSLLPQDGMGGTFDLDQFSTYR